MITTDYMDLIGKFMDKYGQQRRMLPMIATPQECELRKKLIFEESGELWRAIEEKDLIGIADGIADLLYVTFGAAHVFGIPIECIFMEVHRSNMSKPLLGHNEIGNKVQKGNYSKPQIAALLAPYLRERRKLDKEMEQNNASSKSNSNL